MGKKEIETERLFGDKYNNHAIIVNKGKVKLVKLLESGNTSITSYDNKVKRVEFNQESQFK